jgi:peptidyl-prolyl cis-trans isomerase SurA
MKSEKLACSSTPARENLLQRFLARLGTGAFALFGTLCVSGALSLGLLTAPARADDGSDTQQGISAVVNDQIISHFDLEQRVKLIMVTSGIPDTPDNRRRIEPQVLRSLVDERLELQEAKRLEVKVEDKEIDDQLNGIAKRANMTTAQIDEFLKQNGVSRSSLVDQIKAEIAWNKVVGQQFSPLITISDEEINDVMKRLTEESDEPRYLISEILLTFDTPAQEQEMIGGAERLAEQIRLGAPFAAVAQQFSRSASAANGGDIGWVHRSQLPEEVGAVVADMGIGAISPPIKTLNGIYLIHLRSKQVGMGADPMKDEWTLVRILLPLTPDAPNAAVERRAQETARFRSEFTTCSAVDQQIKSYLGGQASEPRSVLFGSLDGRMQELVSKSKPGDLLPPIRSKEGIEMIAVCGHKVNDPQMPTRESIEDNLFSQQLSMMSRRHLRDLRRDAVIEMR